MDHAICTKCGHDESSGDDETPLSRLCPRCGYMRLVYRHDEGDEEMRARLAGPLTEAELREIWLLTFGEE